MTSSYQGQVLELTEANFDSVVAENELVFIDFWAPWCRPCVAFASIYEHCAARSEGVVFAKINVDEQTKLAQEFSVRSIPFLMLAREQVIVFAEAGSLSEAAVMDVIAQARQLDMKTIRANAQASTRTLKFIGPEEA